MKTVFSNWKVRCGLIIIFFFILLALVGPALVRGLGLDPYMVDRKAMRAAPGAQHWLGTDSSGSDVFAQWVLGARGSIFIGLSAGLLMTAIAIVFGLISGFFGGWLDSSLNSVFNLLMVIPAVPLAIIVAGYMRSVNELTIILIIGLVGWPGQARALRSQVMSLRNRDFVAASQMAGENHFRQLFVDILPHMSGYVFNMLLSAIVNAIFAEASLRFLGIGSPDTLSWGSMLELSRVQGAILSGMWWWYLPPGLSITLIGTGAALLNFGFDEMVNPRLRSAKRSVYRTLLRLERSARQARMQMKPFQAAAMPQQQTSLLYAEELNVKYIMGKNPVSACRDVTLTVFEGEVLGIAGESGSGKSTLVHAMLRLLRPPGVVTQGRVLWFKGDGSAIDLLGLSERELRPLRWKEFSIVLQSAMDALNPVTRISAQFVDVLRAKQPGMSRKAALARTRELLEMVGIPSERAKSYPHELSGGMRQRASIALALACNPRLIVMDEATTAVDVVTQRQIMDYVLRLREQLGFAVLFVTHDLALLLEVADRIAIMHEGCIVEVSDVEDIGSGNSHPYTRRLFDSFPRLRSSGDMPPPQQALTGEVESHA